MKRNKASLERREKNHDDKHIKLFDADIRGEIMCTFGAIRALAFPKRHWHFTEFNLLSANVKLGKIHGLGRPNGAGKFGAL
jgi:hypothetical protein